MEENIVDAYLDRITKADKPGYFLAEFFCTLYGIKSIPQEFILFFARMNKLYGRKRVFMAVCDTADVNNFEPNKPFGLLTYFIKRRLENDIPTTIEYINTKANENRIEKLKNRKKKLKIRNPFDNEQ
jgi:hypothetical protein